MSGIRECKCVVEVEGRQGGSVYRETFTTLGRCADHAVHKVRDHFGKYSRSVQMVKVSFRNWLDYDDDRKVDVM